MGSKRINLEHRLRITVLLAVLFFVGAVWGVLFIKSSTLIRSAYKEAFDAVENQAAAEFDSMADPVERQLLQLREWGQAGMFSEHSEQPLVKLFTPVLRTVGSADAFILTDSRGRNFRLSRIGDSIFQTAPADSAELANRHSAILVDPTADTGSVKWTKPYVRKSDGRLLVTASVSWSDTAGIKTALSFDIFLNRIQVLLQSLTVGDGGKVILVDRAFAFGGIDSLKEKTLFPEGYEGDGITADLLSRNFRDEHEIAPGMFSAEEDTGTVLVKFVPVKKLLPQYALMIMAPEKGLNEKVERRALLMNAAAGAAAAVGAAILFILIYYSVFTYKLMRNAGELNTIFSKSGTLDAFLENTVSVIARFMRVPVCSMYLYDEQQNMLTLKATHGLNKKLVNQISLAVGEGLVGTAMKELRPLRFSGASLQEGYRRIEGLNEEAYESFLAVPIARGIHKIGVLTVQKKGSSTFSARSLETLEILAVQLTGVLETAGVLLSASSDLPEFAVLEKADALTEIRGKTAAPGYAFGPGSVDHKRDIFTILKRMKWETHFTLKDFENAVTATENELGRLQRLVEERLEDSAAMIFTAHLLMLKDASFAGAIRKHIENGTAVTESVLMTAEHLIRSFASSPARMIQEKAEDVKDLAVRLLSHFSPDLNRRQNHRDKIVVARELLPSDILVMASEGVKGVVLVSGGVTSHLAILCRSLQIPLMLTTDTAALSLSVDTELLLDANHGILHINPDRDLIRRYRPLLASNIAGVRSGQKGAVTRDGTVISVHANVNLITDISQAVNLSIEGIGLYRSEFPFMIRDSFPTESEQFAIYKKAAEYVANREMTFRTLDIGGDKTLPYLEGIEEENPFLGLRAIRFSLKNEQLFVHQIKAILRAGVNTDLRIMFPMIQSLDEFNTAKAIVVRTIEELQSNGIICHPLPKIGMMVELPAAVTLIEQFAKVSDFFSVGTNDLIQYLLAVDRTNADVAALYKPHHPAVLASIARVAEVSQKYNRDLSVCGDMAGSEMHIPFLIGCGITKLSVDPVFIPRVQECIARIDKNEAAALVESLLTCTTAGECESMLRSTL